MLSGLITAAALAASAPAVAGDAPRQVATPTYVQSIATSAYSPSSPDPAGLTYVQATDEFIISDSEVDEIPTLWNANNINLFTTPRGSLSGTGTGRTRQEPARKYSFSEPAGLGYDPVSQILFVSDDDQDRVIMLRRGSDGLHGTSDDDLLRERFSTADFGSADPEGVEYDEVSGHLFVCDGTNKRIYDITPVNGFDTDTQTDTNPDPTPDDDVVTSFDLAAYGMTDCEGLGHDSERGTLLAVEPISKRIYEYSKAGVLKRIVDIRGIPLELRTHANPASVTLAPSSDPNDAQGTMSYWVVDRQEDEGSPAGGGAPTNPNENDGQLHEFLRPTAEPDPSAPVSFSAAGTSINEASTEATIGLKRPVGGAAATVRVTSASLSATSGADYTAVDKVVPFAAGSTSAAVTVPILQDTLDEADEALQLTLSDPTGDALVATPSSTTVTIADDDPEPTLSVGDAEALEGDNLTFTVSLSAASGKSVTFDATAAPGTAEAGDFAAVAATGVTIPAGSTSTTVVVGSIEDELFEADETFTLSLSGVTNAALGTSTGTGTIRNDDAAPTPSPSPDPSPSPSPEPSPSPSPEPSPSPDPTQTATAEPTTGPPEPTATPALTETATPTPTPTPIGPTVPKADPADLRAAARKLLRGARRAGALRGPVLRLGRLSSMPYARTVAVCVDQRGACRRIVARVPAGARASVRLRLRQAALDKRAIRLTVVVRASDRQGSARGPVRLTR